MVNSIKQYTNIVYRFIFPIMLIMIAGILAWANYTPGTFLTGWDTLHPEFNFPLAFQRMINGVWRYDQGLGAVAIQSHMADLPRVFLLWIASLIIPVQFLRYLTFFVALALGPIGIYFLTSYTLGKTTLTARFSAFFASLAYLFNLGTVQQFNVPLEMFAVQYALIPWLLLTSFRFLEHPTKKNLLWFSILTLFAAPQAQTATLFYAYFACLGLILATYTLVHTRALWSVFKRSAVIMVVTLALNAFWLLPNVYAVITQSTAVRTSKVNEMFSDEAFLKNQEFGTWKDTLILKNFLFDWQLIDPKTLTNIDVLGPWKAHLTIPIVQAYLWLLPVSVLAGMILSIRKKDKRLLALVPALITAYLLIANNQWPTKQLLDMVRETSPLIKEALRFPFTKFSILLMATAAPFIGLVKPPICEDNSLGNITRQISLVTS